MESRKEKLHWIRWFNLVAFAIEEASAELDDFNGWRISLSPPGFLNPSPDTCTLFAIAYEPSAWREPAVYQQIRVRLEDVAKCHGEPALKEFILQTCVIATQALANRIKELNRIDGPTTL
jgi:hypothetical protein